MAVRRSTARTTTPNNVSVTYMGRIFYLYASSMLNFHNGKTLFADEYDKSHLYSLCRKMAKQHIQVVGQDNSFHISFRVFKYRGVWYQMNNVLEKETIKMIPSLEDRDFYKEAVK